VTTRSRTVLTEYSTKEIVIFAFAMLVATFLTVEGTVFVMRNYVLGHPNDPLQQAGGLSPEQKEMQGK
jgi:hypothetical protein